MSDLIIDDFERNLKPERIQFTEPTPFPNWLATKQRRSVSRRFELESVHQGAALALAITESVVSYHNYVYLAFDENQLLVVISPAKGEVLGDEQFELMAAVELAWAEVREDF